MVTFSPSRSPDDPGVGFRRTLRRLHYLGLNDAEDLTHRGQIRERATQRQKPLEFSIRIRGGFLLNESVGRHRALRSLREIAPGLHNGCTQAASLFRTRRGSLCRVRANCAVHVQRFGKSDAILEF
jgi:hypothetical protein